MYIDIPHYFAYVLQNMSLTGFMQVQHVSIEHHIQLSIFQSQFLITEPILEKAMICIT